MTPFPHSISESVTPREALSVMEQNEIHHLPVLRDEEIIGAVSLRELNLILSCTEDKELPLSSLALSSPFLVDVHDRLITVLDGMRSHHVDVAYVTKNARLVGVFSAADCYTLFLRELTQTSLVPEPPDETA